MFQVYEIELSETAPLYDREEDIDIESPELPNANEFRYAISQYPLR